MAEPHPYQSIDHDASISAAPGTGDEQGTVTVEIVIGDHAETRIVVWAEDLARMVVGAMDDPDRVRAALEASETPR